MPLPRTLLAATTAALLLAGCGGGAAPSSPATTTSSTALATPSTSTDLVRFTLPGQAVFPEGTTSAGSTFWVTSTTDGTVFRGSTDTPAAAVLSLGGQDGRTTAVGLDVTRDGSTLVVAGGATGQVSVLDARTGATLRTFTDGLGPDATFLNDVAVTPDGDAWITDSRTPALYRVPAADLGTPGPLGAPLPVGVDLTGTALTYGDGFNANGIVVTADGAHLVVVQSSTGMLVQVDLATRAVAAVDAGGVTLPAGDGMELAPGGPLYVVRNSARTVARVDLAADGSRGTVVSQTELPQVRYPTTATVVGDRLLLVESQFDQRGGGTPVEPFTVASVPLP